MMKEVHKLFMVMLGCKPNGRLTEQHDIFFGIGKSLKDLLPAMKQFWPEAKGKIHIDAWREITQVDGFQIEVVKQQESLKEENNLYFINLGGYKENEFEEYHYKILAVANNLSHAIQQAKKTSFYKHCGFEGAVSHIDDKFGVDVDDLYAVTEILKLDLSQKLVLKITASDKGSDDKLHIGYLPISKI